MFELKGYPYITFPISFIGTIGFIYLYKDSIMMNPWMVVVGILLSIIIFIGFFVITSLLVHWNSGKEL